MAALVAAVAVASLFAEVPLAAVREVVNFTLLLGILAVATDLVRRTPRRGVTVARGLAVVASLAGGAAALEALGVLPGRFILAGSTLARAAGGFGWPNELAMFLAVALPFPIFALRRADRPFARVLALTGIVLVMLGLTSTFSRGSWVAVLAAPAALVFVGEGRVAVRFWGGALMAVAVVDFLTGGALSTRVVSTTSDVLVAQRLLLMTAGLLMFRANPFVGVGPGGFGDALDQFGLQVAGLFDFVGSAHNGYIHMAAESGILGLTALLYFLVAAFSGLSRGVRAARRSGVVDGETHDLRVAYFWAFSTACLVMFFEWPFAHGVGELIVLVVGVGLALAPERRGSR
jgi:O-antigen ligase